jgi:hypothetical protein
MLRKGRAVSGYAEFSPRVEGRRGLLEASQSFILPLLHHLAELYHFTLTTNQVKVNVGYLPDQFAFERGLVFKCHTRDSLGVCRLAQHLYCQTPN